MKRRHLWLLHGALGEAQDWSTLTPWLCNDDCEVHSLDLWSLPHRGAASWSAAASSINRHVARLPGTHVIAGYSLGGRMALHALKQQPRLWHAAALISTHPGLTCPKQRARRRVQDQRWFHLSQSAPERFWQLWHAQPVFANSPFPDAWKHHRQLEIPTGPAHASFITWSLGNQAPFHAWLRKPPMPLLFVTGANDHKFCQLAAQLRQKSSCHQLHHRVISAAGHRVPWEQPAHCGSLIQHLFAPDPTAALQLMP